VRAGYLNPDTGRFNRLDPWSGTNFDPQTLHKYTYAHADPVNGTDPSGAAFILEFSLASTIAAGTRAWWEGARTPTYTGAITAALLLVLLVAMVDVVPKAIEHIEEKRKDRKRPFYRYEIRPGMTYFEAGTDITDRPDLDWSQAVSITFMKDLTAQGIDTIYMYTLMTRAGDVEPHPDGPFVFGGVGQWNLANSISGDDVILTRVVKKPDVHYEGPF